MPNRAQNPYSAFTHLARSVLNARYHREEDLFVMLTCYFDESFDEWKGSEGRPRKFTFVCGYVATVEEWEGFSRQWREFLDRNGIQDFHLTDFCSSKREYKKWADWKEYKAVRDQFMTDAAAIICKYARMGFVSALADSIFHFADKSYQLSETFGGPYGLVGRACAELVRKKKSTFASKRARLRYVFEDGGPNKGGLSRSFSNLIPAFPDPIFEPGKNSKPSPKYPDGRVAVLPLQSADFLTGEVRKMFTDQIRTKPVRKVRESLNAITDMRMSKNLLTLNDVEAMCKRLNVPKRLDCPITDSTG